MAEKLRFYEASKKYGRIYASIGLKLLRPILVRAGTENSLFFCLLRRNQYESFRRWLFALVLFFSQRMRYFFTCYSHESRNTKRTLYLRHRKNELRKNKSRHACSQRAQLLGVAPHELGGQKLAEILFFYVGQKISGRICAHRS